MQRAPCSRSSTSGSWRTNSKWSPTRSAVARSGVSARENFLNPPSSPTSGLPGDVAVASGARAPSDARTQGAPIVHYLGDRGRGSAPRDRVPEARRALPGRPLCSFLGLGLAGEETVPAGGDRLVAMALERGAI